MPSRGNTWINSGSGEKLAVQKAVVKEKTSIMIKESRQEKESKIVS
jgi:hypothetical protein